jgi:hypothetical protein
MKLSIKALALVATTVLSFSSFANLGDANQPLFAKPAWYENICLFGYCFFESNTVTNTVGALRRGGLAAETSSGREGGLIND